jgi:hypothetical protein
LPQDDDGQEPRPAGDFRLYSEASPRSLVRRVLLASAAGIAVIVAFAIAYYFGAFAPR